MNLIKDYTLPDCLLGFESHRSAEAYAIIGQGLWLMKAQALHCLPQKDRGQGRKSSPTGCTEVGLAGFEGWLDEHVCGPDNYFIISKSTVYNYIRAAAALGLTAADDDDSLQALREKNAMEGKRLRDLYKPVPTLENGSNGRTPSPPSKPEDYWNGFDGPILRQFAPESQSVMALYQLPEPHLDSLENTIRTALDVIKEVKAARASNQPKRR